MAREDIGTLTISIGITVPQIHRTHGSQGERIRYIPATRVPCTHDEAQIALNVFASNNYHIKSTFIRGEWMIRDQLDVQGS